MSITPPPEVRRIQLRRGTTQEWEQANPVLLEAEIGIDTEAKQFKVGDGISPWLFLEYGGLVGAMGPRGEVGPPGDAGPPGPSGTGVRIVGTASDPSELPDPFGGQVGDAYVIGTDLWVWTGAKWENMGEIRGPAGEQGPRGEGGVGVPEGGTVGQLLTKAGVSDFDTDWGDAPPSLPPGGSTGQLLAKASPLDNDAAWVDKPSSLPPGGATDQTLAKASPSDFDVKWAPPPPPPTPPQVYSGASAPSPRGDNLIWINPGEAQPAGVAPWVRLTRQEFEALDPPDPNTLYIITKPPPPEIEVVGTNSAGATTVSIPAHQAGDLLIMCARRANNTAASVPAASGTVPAWSTIFGGTGAGTLSLITASAIASASGRTSGTWTNADRLLVMVLRSDGTLAIGATAENSVTAGTTSLVYPALTPQRKDGSSWGVRVAARAGTGNVDIAAPPGWTRRHIEPSPTGLLALHTRAMLDDNIAADTVTWTSAVFRTHTIEVTAT
jgi:hypothetical protein